MAMGTFPFQWPVDPAEPTGLDVGLLPSLIPPLPAVVPDDGVGYYAATAAGYMHAPSLPELAAPFPSTAAAAAELAMRREEEVAGIRLVHLLMICAGTVEAGNHALASAHLADANAALAAISTASGIGRVAVHFTAALSRLLFPSPATPPATNSADHAFLFHHFYEACPYLKFAHFTANQAILEAFRGCDRLHVIDFSLMQGLQWPALIQALALRPGGPPFLRITGIGPPSSPGRDELRDVGLRLADVARSVHVRFSFRGVAANSLDEVRPWMLQIAPGEAVAVNSVLQLHRLLADPADQAPIDAVLECSASVQPKISRRECQRSGQRDGRGVPPEGDLRHRVRQGHCSHGATRAAVSVAGQAGARWAERCRSCRAHSGSRGCWLGCSPARGTASGRLRGASRSGGTAARCSQLDLGIWGRRSTVTQ